MYALTYCCHTSTYSNAFFFSLNKNEVLLAHHVFPSVRPSVTVPMPKRSDFHITLYENKFKMLSQKLVPKPTTWRALNEFLPVHPTFIF